MEYLRMQILGTLNIRCRMQLCFCQNDKRVQRHYQLQNAHCDNAPQRPPSYRPQSKQMPEKSTQVPKKPKPRQRYNQSRAGTERWYQKGALPRRRGAINHKLKHYALL